MTSGARILLFCALALFATPLFAQTPQGAPRDAAVSDAASCSDAVSRRDELETEFFDRLMWLCDSPVEEERDATEAELARRFAEFEPVWQERTFLSDGEVGEESRVRFARAEEENRRRRIAETQRAFDAQWRVAPSSDGGVTRQGRVRASWRVALRIVWLAPDFRAFSWRDDEGALWVPRAQFSEPEILPEFDADAVEIDVTLVRAAGGALPERAGESTAAFDALIGADFRPWGLTLTLESEEKEYRSGELTLRGATVARQENGDWLVALRIAYDAAFDAFDSHRVWYDSDDFLLVASEEIVKATRMRVKERSVRGERVELLFRTSDQVDAALTSGRAVLCCRLPRFFMQTRVEVPTRVEE